MQVVPGAYPMDDEATASSTAEDEICLPLVGDHYDKYLGDATLWEHPRKLVSLLQLSFRDVPD